jgi:hypothetical protein
MSQTLFTPEIIQELKVFANDGIKLFTKMATIASQLEEKKIDSTNNGDLDKVIKLLSGPKKLDGCVDIDGSKLWYKDGVLHREDGPAIEHANGDKFWYRDGKLHRLDGPAEEYASGTRCWYKDGKCHREDGPSCEYSNGDKIWHRHGKFHREDGPACEYSDGTKKWYRDGKLHREDGPACEYSDGRKMWHNDGNLHREGGPACEYSDGTKKWYKDGNLHRLDGPAIEWAGGTKYWYKDGNLHREDGPAIEYEDGSKIWYLNDVPQSDPEKVKHEASVLIRKQNEDTITYLLRYLDLINLNDIKKESAIKEMLCFLLSTDEGLDLLKNEPFKNTLKLKYETEYKTYLPKLEFFIKKKLY